MNRKILSVRLKASFTIEAAVIVPIIMLILVWFINTSLSIHNEITSKSDAVDQIIEKAPETSGNVPAKYAELINISTLDARKELLTYKSVKDGIKTISGGISDGD